MLSLFLLACTPSPDSGDPAPDDCEALLTAYEDVDGDGYGDPESSTASCTIPEGFAAESGDCDDTDPASWPGAAEVCDGADNDCDGEVDEGLAGTWYADGDGDGYGEGDGVAGGCEAPAGHAAEGGDCDDEDAAVNPGAVELCDGIDNNCTEDSGGALWRARDGTETDLSAALAAATPAAPAAITLTEPGTLHLCEGLHAVSLTAAADVAVEGWGKGETRLTSETGRVLTVAAGGLAVSVEGVAVTAGGVSCAAESTLTITDAKLTGETDGDGGSLSATDGCTLRLSAVTLTDSTAGRGGALFLSQSTAEISESTLSDSRADTGGAVYLFDSTLTLEGSVLSGSRALDGGAVALVGSTLLATDTAFDDNHGSGGPYTSGGGLQLQDDSHADLTDCTVKDNVASWGGGLWLDASSSAAGVRVDFITNHPDDAEKDGTSYTFFKDTTFSCAADSDACD